MPGLVPGNHAVGPGPTVESSPADPGDLHEGLFSGQKSSQPRNRVDGRDEPGHDGGGMTRRGLRVSGALSVMPGLVPGNPAVGPGPTVESSPADLGDLHEGLFSGQKSSQPRSRVDGRDEPGHDGGGLARRGSRVSGRSLRPARARPGQPRGWARPECRKLASRPRRLAKRFVFRPEIVATARPRGWPGRARP